MKRFLAQALSVLAHPLFAGTYAAVILYGLYDGSSFLYQTAGIDVGGFWGTADAATLSFTQAVFLLTALAPILLILLLKRLGVVSSFEMDDKRERIVPYLFCILCYVLAVFYVLSQDMILDFFIFAGVVLALTVCFLVNLVWKISAHCTAAAGLIPVTVAAHNAYGVADFFVFFLVVMAGLVGVARLYLRKHTVRQVFAGYLTGFLIMSIAVELGMLATYFL